MKKSKLLVALMLLAGMTVSGSALADRWGHHDHIGVGVYFGAPYHPYYPYPYYSPYPYYPYAYAPPVVVVPQQAPPPPVYVEQPQAQVAPAGPPPSAQAANSWYHCDKPDGYYPYVKECPGGWKAVTPTPPQP